MNQVGIASKFSGLEELEERKKQLNQHRQRLRG